MELFIIGNGFDINHGLLTKYSDFYKYLHENRADILDIMNEFYDTSKESDLWSDFETKLETGIDYSVFSNIIFENTPDFTSDNFRDKDWYEAQICIEQKSKKLLDAIHDGLDNWIRSLDTSQVSPKFRLNKDSYYFTFNYTDVLEKVYKIPIERILHVHNKIGGKLIFGHGKSIENFNVIETLYGTDKIFLDIDENGDIISNEIGHETFAEDEVCSFYKRMRKPTSDIIKSNIGFFNSLSKVDKIIIFGFSYNKIDYPYLKQIAKSVHNAAKWILYFHSENDKSNANNLISEMKVNHARIELKKITKDLICLH